MNKFIYLCRVLGKKKKTNHILSTFYKNEKNFYFDCCIDGYCQR